MLFAIFSGLECGILCFPVTFVVTTFFRQSRDYDFHKRGSHVKTPSQDYSSSEKITSKPKQKRRFKHKVTSHKLRYKFDSFVRKKNSLLSSVFRNPHPRSRRYYESTESETEMSEEEQYERYVCKTILQIISEYLSCGPELKQRELWT